MDGAPDQAGWRWRGAHPVTRRAAVLAAAAAPVAGPGVARLGGVGLHSPQSAIPVDLFATDGAADDTVAIRSALQAACTVGGVLLFSARVYRISGTLDVPSGVHMVGTGAVGGAGPDEVVGTTLRRVSDCVMLRMAGRSFRGGGPMKHSAALRGILLDGGDFASDTAQFVAASRVTISDCFFVRSRGRHLLLHEVFDSRISNTDFDGGGTADGNTPAVELRSGGGYEYTNHVHFTGCRLESYPGVALALTGGNTNKIYVTDCKLESLASNCSALVANNAVALHVAGLQITGRGHPGTVLDSLLSIQDSSFIVGDLMLEHAAWDGGATLGAYVDLAMCRGVDLQVSVIDGQNAMPLGSYVRLAGGEACSVRGLFRRGRHVETRSWVA